MDDAEMMACMPWKAESLTVACLLRDNSLDSMQDKRGSKRSMCGSLSVRRGVLSQGLHLPNRFEAGPSASHRKNVSG